jgi:hypothetical protein
MFLPGAKILYIRQYFGRRQHFVNPLTFWTSANILEIRQHFGNPPTFLKSAYFSVRRQFFVDLLDFLLLQIFEYIFSIYLGI